MGADHGRLRGLQDDDHLHYHNDARGDIRYYTKTQLDTGQLDSRYYTEAEISDILVGKSDVGHGHIALDIIDWNESVDDRVNNLLVAGDNITLVYDDGADTLTINGADCGVNNHGELIGLDNDDHTQYLLAAGTRQLTEDWNFGSYTIYGTGSITTVAFDPIFLVNEYKYGDARRIFVFGDYAYIATEDRGLYIYNVSNPNNPNYITKIDDGGRAYNVKVYGNHAYLANYDDGLRIYDVSHPPIPVNISHIDNGGKAYDLIISGRYLYLANYDDGLRVYDILDPYNPINVGHIGKSSPHDDNLISICKYNNYIYAGTFGGDIYIYDISDPTNISYVDKKLSYERPESLYINNYHLFIACSHNDLRIYTLSDPENLNEVGHLFRGGGAYDICVRDKYAYIAWREYGIYVIDVSDPSNPFEVGYINNDNGSVYGICVLGKYAYTANRGPQLDGLSIYNIGGIETQGISAGSGYFTTINVGKDIQIQGDANIRGALSVGDGFVSHAPSSIKGSLDITGDYKSNGIAGISGWVDDGANFRIVIKGGIITDVGPTILGGYYKE